MDNPNTPLLSDPLASSQVPRFEQTAPHNHSRRDSIADTDNEDDSRRRLNFYDGVALILGIQIGSGIFVSPSLVARNAGSEPGAILIWCVAGLLTWACAACYIELGTRMPVNGGPQEFLTHCFNRFSGFLVSWACIFTVKPCSAAILVLFVADYTCDTISPNKEISTSTRKLVALFVIALVTGVNCTGNKASNMTTKAMLACKILGVGFIIVMGLSVLIIPRNATIKTTMVSPSLPHPNLSSFTDALLSALWAYSGWETVCIDLS
jgi:L-type amino acid transporter 6